ncbi:hypothetical protein [Pseudomonas putida]|uniref:hypothetical protein n=1 Tax=Pseudomonas putida TaxID=303 RepID=UPI001EF91F91|nr:hypothetical protein [Pseudomonas putida]
MDDKYFIDSVFANGGRNRDEYLAKRLPDETLRLQTSENDFGEYYVVSADGTLQGWGGEWCLHDAAAEKIYRKWQTLPQGKLRKFKGRAGGTQKRVENTELPVVSVGAVGIRRSLMVKECVSGQAFSDGA